MPTSSTTSTLAASVDAIIARFEQTNSARDHAVTSGRQVIRLAANAVRALHRDERADADALLQEASALLDEIRHTRESFPAIYWAGYVQDAMKEYAEAAITGALLAGEPIPTPDALGVEDAAYLNALAEAGSELRRDVLDRLRRDDYATAERLLDAMDAIYELLVTVDFADAITGGLRRTTDQFRAVLERTRGDLTVAVRQHRLEQALRQAEQRLGS